MKPLPSFAALAVAVVLGAFAALLMEPTHAQSMSASTQYIPSGWPPRPSNLVHVDSAELAPLGFLTVSANSTVDVFNVPLDRWFVMTDVTFAGAAMWLVEVAGTTVTTRLQEGTARLGVGWYQSACGVAFPPGSRVAFQNQGGASTTLTFAFSGYLTGP